MLICRLHLIKTLIIVFLLWLTLPAAVDACVVFAELVVEIAVAVVEIIEDL